METEESFLVKREAEASMNASCRCELLGSQSARGDRVLRDVCCGKPWRGAHDVVIFLVVIVVTIRGEVCFDVVGALGSRFGSDHFTPMDCDWCGSGYGCTFV